MVAHQAVVTAARVRIRHLTQNYPCYGAREYENLGVEGETHARGQKKYTNMQPIERITFLTDTPTVKFLGVFMDPILDFKYLFF